MKMPALRRRFLVILVATALHLCAPAFGQATTDMLSEALNLVHQVEKPGANPSTPTRQIDLLTQALQMAQKAPNHRLKGHRVLAIQAIRGAIAEIQSGDPNHKAAAFLQTADAELSASVSLASSADASPSAAASSALSTNMAVTSPPALTPSGNDGASLPPGITTEMEQAFLVRYKAALGKSDPDAYFSLIAMDPHMDAKAKEDMQGMELFGAAMNSSNPNRTYSFVPVSPNDQKDEPTAFDGKMYGNYLPPAIALKITFGKPIPSTSNQPVAVGDAIVPLCVQDGRLMLIGMKEIPGAVPPPVKQPYNFGIKPNIRPFDDKAKNPDSFASLGDFISSLQQPKVEVIASGETDLAYYAICRIAPNLFVYAEDSRPGQGNYSFYIHATDANKQELKGEKTWIHLVEVPTSTGTVPIVQGTVFHVTDGNVGPLTVNAQYWDDSGNKSKASFSKTVDWK